MTSQAEFVLGQGLGDLLQAAGIPKPTLVEQEEEAPEPEKAVKKETASKKKAKKAASEKKPKKTKKDKKTVAQDSMTVELEAELETQVATLTATQKELESKITKLEQDLNAEKIKLEEAQDRDAIAQMTVENLKDDLKSSKEEKKALEAKADSAQEQQDHLHDQLKTQAEWREKALAILNNTAVLLYEVEMDSASIEVMKKILKLDPDNELVRENLKSLEDEEYEGNNNTGN